MSWDGFAAAAHEFVTEGSTVVALGDYSGTYKATGNSFKARSRMCGSCRMERQYRSISTPMPPSIGVRCKP